MTRQFRIECRGCPVADGQVLAPGFIPGERQMSEDEWTRLRCDTFEKSNKSCQNEPNYGLTPFRPLFFPFSFSFFRFHSRRTSNE
jgi:hypothetical protein